MQAGNIPNARPTFCPNTATPQPAQQRAQGWEGKWELETATWACLGRHCLYSQAGSSLAAQSGAGKEGEASLATLTRGRQATRRGERESGDVITRTDCKEPLGCFLMGMAGRASAMLGPLPGRRSYVCMRSAHACLCPSHSWPRDPCCGGEHRYQGVGPRRRTRPPSNL